MTFHFTSRLCGLSIAAALLFGCAGKGATIPLDIRPSENGQVGKKADTLSVGVLPFEDERQEPKRLGVRRHLWGAESLFDLAGGKPGDQVAAVVAEHLRLKKGWNAEVVRPSASATPAATNGAQSAAPQAGGHDVILSGKLLELSANANSKVMRTAITVTSKLLVQGVNAADGSTVRMTLNGAGSQSVFWFESEDVQRLLTDVIDESLEKLATDTKVEGKLLRLK